MRDEVAEYMKTLHESDIDSAEETSPTGLWKVQFSGPGMGQPHPFYCVVPGENRAEAWMLGERVLSMLQDREGKISGKHHLTAIKGVMATPVEET